MDMEGKGPGMGKTVCLSTEMYPPKLGGVAGAARRTAWTLRDLGYTVHVVNPVEAPDRPDGEVESREEDGLHVHRVYQRRIMNGTKFVVRDAILALDDKVCFDAFHGFFLPATYPCLLAVEASGRDRPVIGSIRGNDILSLKDHPFHRQVALEILEKADWITSVNQDYLGRAMEDVDISGRCTVIRNALWPAPEIARPWRLTEENRGVVGLVGQFRKVKDIPLLVRSYNALPRTLRRELVLAGFFSEADEEAWTQTLIEEFGIEGEVTLTGAFPPEQVFDHLRRMHVYVQCSAFEGLPNALIEAGGLGVPLVATAVGGMAEVLRDGETALLVPHGDPAALAAAIERILSDDGLAASLSEGARTLADDLSPKRERDAWATLYDQLLVREPVPG
jgi:glycosyltransferase involved in cell wall biosynthesis